MEYLIPILAIGWTLFCVLTGKSQGYKEGVIACKTNTEKKGYKLFELKDGTRIWETEKSIKQYYKSYIKGAKIINIEQQ